MQSAVAFICMLVPNGLPLLDLFQSITPYSSEADVERGVVIPLLSMLGYSKADWKAQVRISEVKLDFLICPQEFVALYPPYLVIEVKAPNKKIAQNVWQISNYMRRSRAILGLLTNGYKFCILYNHNEQVSTIKEYTQTALVEQFTLFYKLLCKSTCLKLNDALHRSQQQVCSSFFNLTAKAFNNENMIDSFNQTKIPSTQSMAEEIPVPIEPKKKNSMIITIFNNKGGVGKTTTTINLAAAINKLGKRVLLIDIDAQANLTMGLGIDPLADIEEQGRKDISHLLTEPRTTLEDTRISKSWDDVQLDIVPSHIRLSDMEATLIMTPDVDRVLTKKLKNYRDQYDYIFIDPPPSFGKANTISLMASSAVLIPTQLAPYPIRALEYVIKRAIAVDQSREEPLPILGVAISMYSRAANKIALSMTEKILEIIARNPDNKNVDLWPQNTWIPNLSVVATTPGKGYPLCFSEFDDELNSRDKEAAQDAFNCYTALAKHLLSITQADK